MTARRPLAAATLAVAGLAAFPTTSGSAVRRLDIRADVRMMPGGGATLIQQGTFRGAPFGRGRVRVRTLVGRGRGSVVRFVLTTSRGTVRGDGDCAVTFKGSRIFYDGTARITSGTGAYRRMRGRNLRVGGRGGVSSERFIVTLKGRVSS
jgi:hypothetical protein